MLITRKIGTLLHGRTSTFSVLAATTLGLTAGMLPANSGTCVLLVMLGAAILVLNTNLFLAGVAAALGKLMAFPLLGASFALGRLLLDGPLQPLFRRAVNAPLIAWLGLELYVVPGSLVLGSAAGLGLGIAVLILLRGMRTRLAVLTTDSTRYTAFTERPWVRLSHWVFFGKRGKLSYAELNEGHRRWGNPIRPVGLVAVALGGALIVLVGVLTSDRLATALVVAGLERANGATVDLEHADLDLAGGRFRLEGFAVANPDALDHNLFAADAIEGDFSASDLLRRRFAIDLIEIATARAGGPRAQPGRRVGPSAPAPTVENDAPPADPAVADTPRDLDELLARGKVWKRRLDRLRYWTDWLGGAPDGTTGKTAPDLAHDRDAWVRERIAAVGITRVRADDLISGAPTLLIRRLTLDGLVIDGEPDATYRVEATRLSTHPARVPEGSPRIRVASAAGDQQLDLALPLAGRSAGAINLALAGLPVDRLTQGLSAAIADYAHGGTVDVALTGAFEPGALDLPLTLTLHDTTLAVPGASPRQIDHLPLTLAVGGTVNRPALTLDRQQLSRALVAAGADELASAARSKANDALRDATDKLNPKLGDTLGEAAEKGLTDWLRRR